LHNAQVAKILYLAMLLDWIYLSANVQKDYWDYLTFTHGCSHQQSRVAVLSERTWFTYWHLSLCRLPQALRLGSWS